jgi:hypothetical protein
VTCFVKCNAELLDNEIRNRSERLSMHENSSAESVSHVTTESHGCSFDRVRGTDQYCFHSFYICLLLVHVDLDWLKERANLRTLKTSVINTIKKLLRHETTSSDDSDSDSYASESEATDRLDDNQFSDGVVTKF